MSEGVSGAAIVTDLRGSCDRAFASALSRATVPTAACQALAGRPVAGTRRGIAAPVPVVLRIGLAGYAGISVEGVLGVFGGSLICRSHCRSESRETICEMLLYQKTARPVAWLSLHSSSMASKCLSFYSGV